jgi:hypothetical protein
MDEKHENPSIYTILYWLIQDKKIGSEIFFKFLEFYWPSFTKKNEFIFLKEKYSEEEFNRLINEKDNPEYWINMLTVDDFFSETNDGAEKSAILAKALVEIWTVKLKNDFPEKKFIVEYLSDKEYGDYGLTFYQIAKS